MAERRRRETEVEEPSGGAAPLEEDPGADALPLEALSADLAVLDAELTRQQQVYRATQQVRVDWVQRVQAAVALLLPLERRLMETQAATSSAEMAVADVQSRHRAALEDMEAGLRQRQQEQEAQWRQVSEEHAGRMRRLERQTEDRTAALRAQQVAAEESTSAAEAEAQRQRQALEASLVHLTAQVDEARRLRDALVKQLQGV